MTFQFTAAANANAIAECQFGSGATLGFPSVTSCLCIVAPVQSSQDLCGLHLSIFCPGNGESFTDTPAANVTAVRQAMTGMNYDPAGTLIFGAIGAWSHPAQPELAAAYQALLTAFGNPPTMDKPDGSYTVTRGVAGISVTAA